MSTIYKDYNESGAYHAFNDTRTLPDKVEVRADGQVVVDGYQMDLRGADVGAYIYVGRTDRAGNPYRLDFRKKGAAEYELKLSTRTSAASPAVDTTTTYTTFPQYVVWPTGTTQEPQAITESHPDNVPPLTAEQIAAKAKAKRKRLRTRIALAADTWDNSRVGEWPKEASMVGDFVDADMDATNTAQAEAKARYNNTVLWAKSLIGLAWYAVQQWQDGATFTASAWTPADVTDWEKAAEKAVDVLEAELGGGIKKWYLAHNHTGWGGYYARGTNDAPTVPGVYTTGTDFGGVLLYQPPTGEAPAPAWAHWDHLIVAQYVAAQKASVGL